MRSNLAIQIPSGQPSSSSVAPPPYTISPLSPDPVLLARALEEYTRTQDPSQWGLRRSHRSSSEARELTGFLGFVIWLAEACTPPEPTFWSHVGTPGFMAMSTQHGLF